MGHVLVIDDELISLQSELEGALREHTLSFCESGGAAIRLLEQHPGVECALLDVRMPPELGTSRRTEGLAVLDVLRKRWPHIPVVVMTAYDEKAIARRALRSGAFHYLRKPLDIPRLRTMVDAAVATCALRRELAQPDEEATGQAAAEEPSRDAAAGETFGCLVGASPAMQRVYEDIEVVAPTDAPVLVLGPSGSGKKLVAREIHTRSRRRNGPFEVLDCTSVPETLFESEVFGARKGAFTGATSREGRFHLAHRGTLFLDEIGELPSPLQPKLLRAVEDQRIRPVGAEADLAVDVRLISATNRDILGMVEQEQFREDLYFRLKTFCIHLPTLKQRSADIPRLAEHFLARHGARLGAAAPRLTDAALQLLLAHPWPGNVRELEHVVQGALIRARGEAIQPDHVQQALEAPAPAKKPLDPAEALWQDVLQGRTPRSLVEFRNAHGEGALRDVIRRALDCSEDIRGAARLLGLLNDDDDKRGYDNFRQWMRRLGVQKTERDKRSE